MYKAGLREKYRTFDENLNLNFDKMKDITFKFYYVALKKAGGLIYPIDSE